MKLYINYKTRQHAVTGEKMPPHGHRQILEDRGFTFAGYVQGNFASFDDKFIVIRRYDELNNFEKKYPLTDKARLRKLESAVKRLENAL